MGMARVQVSTDLVEDTFFFPGKIKAVEHRLDMDRLTFFLEGDELPDVSENGVIALVDIEITEHENPDLPRREYTAEWREV